MPFRPLAVIRAYWAEVICLEEQARFLEPVYFWEVSSNHEKES